MPVSEAYENPRARNCCLCTSPYEKAPLKPVCTKKSSAGTVPTSEYRIELDELDDQVRRVGVVPHGMSTKPGSLVIAGWSSSTPDTSHDESMSNRSPLP